MVARVVIGCYWSAFPHNVLVFSEENMKWRRLRTVRKERMIHLHKPMWVSLQGIAFSFQRGIKASWLFEIPLYGTAAGWSILIYLICYNTMPCAVGQSDSITSNSLHHFGLFAFVSFGIRFFSWKQIVLPMPFVWSSDLALHPSAHGRPSCPRACLSCRLCRTKHPFDVFYMLSSCTLCFSIFFFPFLRLLWVYHALCRSQSCWWNCITWTALARTLPLCHSTGEKRVNGYSLSTKKCKSRFCMILRQMAILVACAAETQTTLFSSSTKYYIKIRLIRCQNSRCYEHHWISFCQGAHQGIDASSQHHLWHAGLDILMWFVWALLWFYCPEAWHVWHCVAPEILRTNLTRRSMALWFSRWWKNLDLCQHSSCAQWYKWSAHPVQGNRKLKLVRREMNTKDKTRHKIYKEQCDNA